MSKPAHRRAAPRALRLAAGLIALAASQASPASSPPPPPVLRLDDRLDLQRIKTVGDDERAVLRVEWQSARGREDENRMVQDMLDRLRRMEATVGDIRRLVRAMPAPGATPLQEPAPPPAPSVPGWLPAAAGTLVIAGLLAYWRARRRPAPKKPPTPVVAPEPLARPAPAPLSPASAAREAASVMPDRPAPPTAPVPTPPTLPVAESPAPAPLRPAAEHAPSPEVMPEPAAPVQGGDNIIEFVLEEHPDPPPEPASRAVSAPPAFSEVRDETGRGHGDETLELAEIMLSMGLAQGAAQTLTEHIRANPRQALYHWLKLLDIHKKSGNKDQFEEAARELRQNFNIQADDWMKVSPDGTAGLEDYPRIAGQVVALWPRPDECRDYLSRLLEDNRGGTRAGFPRPVAEEILLLIAVLKEAPAQAEGV